MSLSESGSLTAPYKRHVFLKFIFFGIMQPTVLFKDHLVFLVSHCGNWGRRQAQKMLTFLLELLFWIIKLFASIPGLMFSINIYETIADIMFNHKYGRIADHSQCLIDKTIEGRHVKATHINTYYKLMKNKWSGIHTLIVYSYPLISEYMSFGMSAQWNFRVATD